MKKRVLISGGEGSLAQQLKLTNTEFVLSAPSKNEMNVYNLKDVDKEVKGFSPDYFVHTAAITRPMSIHEDSPSKSINTNIIGSSNVSSICVKYGVKLIYISTDYVYPGSSGDYEETDGVLPFTNYGWSKLGGECAVRMCPTHLILRVAMTEKPFPHPKALTDMRKSSIYTDEVADIIFKLLNENGTINVGGEPKSVYDFVKEANPNIKKIRLKDIRDVNMASDCSMNTSRMRTALQNNE